MNVRQHNQPVAHRVLAHRPRLDELQQVVGAAGLQAGPRQPVAAERLAADHRAGDPAVDVQVADRRALADAADGRRVAGEQPAGERERRAPSTTSQACSTSRTRSTASSGPKISSLEHRRVVGQVGGDRRRAEPAVGRRDRLGARRRSRPCRAASSRVAVDPLLRRALDHRRHVGAERLRLADDAAPGPRRRAARAAGRRSPRGRAPARRPSTSGPAKANAEPTIAGTASSRSASASTITQFLPPSSATTRLKWRCPDGLGGGADDLAADRQRAGERDRVHLGIARRARRRPRPRRAAARSPPAGRRRRAAPATSRSAQRGRLLGRLEHDRVAGRERRRGHPARDREREVPRRDHARRPRAAT